MADVSISNGNSTGGSRIYEGGGPSQNVGQIIRKNRHEPPTIVIKSGLYTIELSYYSN